MRTGTADETESGISFYCEGFRELIRNPERFAGKIGTPPAHRKERDEPGIASFCFVSLSCPGNRPTAQSEKPEENFPLAGRVAWLGGNDRSRGDHRRRRLLQLFNLGLNSGPVLAVSFRGVRSI